MIASQKLKWDSAKDAWLMERLRGQHFICWSAVANEFQDKFDVCYPVGRLMERWHFLKRSAIAGKDGVCHGVTPDNTASTKRQRYVFHDEVWKASADGKGEGMV